MGFFKKIITPKKQSLVQNEEKKVPSAAFSTPTRSTSQRNSSFNTPKSSDKKMRSSPFKKIGKVFSRKKEIKLKSPDVKEGSGDGKTQQPQNYYTTNTDGYEVILEGKKLEYQSDPLSYDDSNEKSKTGAGALEMSCNSTTFCAQDACTPLSDFPTFLSLLFAPNMDDIKNFVFGNGTKATAAGAPLPMAEVITKSGSSSLPFDEGPNRSVSIMDEDESTIDNDGTAVDRVSSVNNQGKSIQSEKIVKIPMNMNDVPSYNSPKNEKMSHLSSKSTADLSDEEIYDSSFTLRFLREISNIGIILTYYRVNEKGVSSSDTVTLTIKPGLARGSRLLEPKLCWSNVENATSKETIISLLEILSIHTSLDPNTEDDCTNFFTITTQDGEVFSFESPTLDERNYVAHGLKNTVSWLSYHLVMGNMATGSQLVSELDEEEGEESGELPSLKTSNRAMNDLTNLFLD